MSRWHFWNKFFSHESAYRSPGSLRSRKRPLSMGRQRTRALFAESLEARLCLSAVSNYIWATNTGSDTVQKIDKTTNTVVATIDSGIPHYPFSVAVDEDSVWV